MVQDIVIREIEKFFLEQGFEETSLKGYKGENIFKYKDDGYYMISRGVESGYYLEDAETLEEAQNKVFEDMARFNIPFNSPEVIDSIKAEIEKYILQAPSLSLSDLELAVRLCRERIPLERIAEEIKKPINVFLPSLLRCGFTESELIKSG